MATIKTQTASAAKKEATKVAFNLESTILEAGRTLAVYMTADQDMANAMKIRDKAKSELDILAASLHKAGVTFKGNRRTDTLGAQIYSMLPETVSEKTRNNYLSAFKRAVREGSPFNLNPSREAAKDIEAAEDIEAAKDAEGIEPPKDKGKGKGKGKGKKRGARTPKGNPPKTPLADVVKMNFITLMKNNRPRAIELLEELEELLLESDSETDE